jgi:multiple sugar transport system substrate-binding protein
MKGNKIFGGILVLWLAAGMVAFAGGSGDKSASKEVLTIWFEKSFSDNANLVMENRIKQFAQETGITVNYEFIAAVDIMTKLNAAIEARNVPDISTGGLYKILSYYPNNPYLDVTGIVEQINQTRPIFDSVREGIKVAGRHYFTPYTSSSSLLFIRKDLFDKQGIPLPSSWDELFDAAIKISDPKNGVYGLGMGCGPTDEDGENTFRVILWDQGASIFDETGNVVIGKSQAAKEMAGKYKQLYDAQAIPPAGVTWDPSGNNKSYLTGESAIVYNAPTLYGAMQSDPNYKELFDNTVVLMPPKGRKESTVLGFFAGWSIMKDSKNIPRAKEFINFMYQADWYNSYMETVAPVFAPVFKDCVNMPLYKEGINKQIMDYVSRAAGYYGYPVKTHEGLALANKNYFKYPVARMLNSLTTKNLSVDAAIRQLEDDIADTAKTIK